MTKANFRQTLNLPRTSFPMRASLAANEPKTLARWEAMRLYEKTVASRDGAERFVFHDGPPYTSGSIHVGHMLNKVLKDFVVRSRLLAGKSCPFVPGWDCHGLPIEHRVMTALNAKGKLAKLEALGDDDRRMAIRRACRAEAEKYQALQAGQMRRLLTLADYEHPYLTMTPDYEHAVLEVFADLLEQGLVYRALKSVHWSIENETALADAELEYRDRTDTAVFVDFEAADGDSVAEAFSTSLDETPSFMIWTTTPWTLPANLAIAVHERFRYALVRVEGTVTVIAADLVEPVTKATGAKSFTVLAETEGRHLVGLCYRHPFCERVSPIVKADYVTLEDGTGLVHTAPGHGAEDNQTAIREGLEVYCPVQGDGTYDETVPQWLHGMSIWEANGRIVDHLRSSGHLFHDHEITHSYPHDWRSKGPVIFRATEQWFIGVDRPSRHGDRTLRELALAACEADIAFVPEWGRNRMRGMLESRPDWCLSRQRTWGLPIPAFATPQGEVFLTPRSVRSVAEVFATRGSDAWFTEAPETLLRGYDPADDPDAPASLRDAGPSALGDLRKMHDIFDVWFESGSSWHAVMRKPGRGFPIDLYLEGSDQHRGWFQTSMLPSLGVTGETPFRAVLTHGFIVDRDGRKMSKSLGNTIEVEDLLKKVGADVARWWVSSAAIENDAKMDMSYFDLPSETYRKVRNTLRFLLGNLADFTVPSTGAAVAPLEAPPTALDAYVLDQARQLDTAVRGHFEAFAFRKAHQLLYAFCNDMLSPFYCAAVKDRLYCDRPDAPRRRRTQRVMWEILEILCRLLSPIVPHTADEVYQALRGEEEFVVLAGPFSIAPVAVDEAWSHVLEARERALKALEEAKASGVDNPLDAGVVLGDPEGRLGPFADELPDVLGVSRVQLAPGTAEVEVQDLRDEPRCDRCWRRDPTTKPVEGQPGALCERCAEAVGG